MFKNAVGGRAVTLALLMLAALAAAPPAQGPFRTIERLEEKRSLGGAELGALLRSSDRLVVIRAALAIGRTKQPAGMALLARRASDSDPAIRAMVVYGIGLIGGAAAAPDILAALDDRADVVRVAALDATDRLENPTVGPPPLSGAQERVALQRVASLLRADDRVLRARAATTLEAFSGGSQDAAALAALGASWRRERDSWVRAHIAWSVYRGFAKKAPRMLLSAALHDNDEVVRIQAVRAFGSRGDPAAIALLRPLLRDPSWRVQEQALESIRILQGGKPTEHLTQIPRGVTTPAPMPDGFAYVRARARTPHTGKPQPPSSDAVALRPRLDPRSVALLTGPAVGPHPRVRIVTTQGNVYVELYPEWAPLTVSNFLNLANRGYYDNNRWFRIVPDFVVQTGDPTGTGNGDAGYAIPAEENPIEQDSYVISMGLNYTQPPNAHAIRDSAGTQFYITLSPQLHLNRDFTVFGRVFWGFDVLGRLVESDRILRIERLPDASE